MYIYLILLIVGLKIVGWQIFTYHLTLLYTLLLDFICPDQKANYKLQTKLEALIINQKHPRYRCNWIDMVVYYFNVNVMVNSMY